MAIRNTGTFRTGRNVLTSCGCCGKLTHSSIDGAGGIELCRVCYEQAGYENEHHDGYHAAGWNGYQDRCAMCNPKAAEAYATFHTKVERETTVRMASVVERENAKAAKRATAKAEADARQAVKDAAPKCTFRNHNGNGTVTACGDGEYGRRATKASGYTYCGDCAKDAKTHNAHCWILNPSEYRDSRPCYWYDCPNKK